MSLRILKIDRSYLQPTHKYKSDNITRRTCVGILALSLLLMLSLIPQHFAQAANITVNASNSAIAEDGLCSLSEAIQNANNDAQTNTDCISGSGGDIITLTVPVEVDGSALFPASNTIFFDSGDSGLPEITSDITITGNAITRTGMADYRFMVVQSAGNLTLDNIIISNGHVAGDCYYGSGDFSGCGGALVSNLGVITLTNATFTNNQAIKTMNTDYPKGGAIMAFGGTLSVSNSTFNGNGSEFGGAIAAQSSTISIIDSAFTDNTAVVSGGAIQNGPFGGELTIAGSVFDGNQVTTPVQSWNGGGAIDNAGSNSQLYVFNTIFNANSVEATTGGGGAIINFNASDAYITNSTFTANHATRGGAILNRGSGATINVFSSTITNNTAESEGGGISNGGLIDTGIANIHNSEISNNTAGYIGGGGGIATRGALTVENTVIDSNTSSSDGGGISVGSGANQSVSIIGSVVSNNFAGSDGGGLYYTENPSGMYANNLFVADSTFDNNEADQGGGIYAARTSISVVRSTFSSNFASNLGVGGGGGIYINSVSVMDMLNSTVSGNSANQDGGGIYISNSSTATINSSTIANNTADSILGADGIHSLVPSSYVVVTDTIVAYNDNLNCYNSYSLGVTDGGNNISTDNTCGFADTGGAGIGDGINPLLGVLADNGGNTKTHALLSTSPAIGNGSSGCPATDQRGAGRTNNCDIGAYETTTSIASLGISADVFDVYEADETTATITVTLNNTGSDAQPLHVQVPLRVTGFASGVGFDYELSIQNSLDTPQTGLVNTLVFDVNAGESSTQTFTLSAVDDCFVENDELVNIAASVVGYASFGGSDTVSVTIHSDDMAPSADAGGPYLIAADSTIQLDGSGSDPDGDPLTYAWSSSDTGSSFDDFTTEDPNYTTGSELGISEVILTVSDGCLNVSDIAMVVVYDPDAGFVTGGGWIDSPEGAYFPDPSLTGKANFGFVSKYKRGATTPIGNTEFQFQTADFNFHSSSYDWLVVTGRTYAQFKGTGTINGEGNYRFMVWAGDNSPDTFRIRIWEENEVTATEVVIYDNGFDQAISGGAIMVHTK